MSLIDRLRSAAQQVAQTAQRLAEQRQSATPAQPAQQPAQKLSTFSTRQLHTLQGGSGFDAPANRYTTLGSPFAPTAPVADEVTAPDPAEVEMAYAGIRDQPVAMRAHAFIETLRQYEGDPAFQAALIEHGLRNDGDEVLHQTVIDVFGNEGGRYFNSTFDEADRGLLAGAFTAARESGVLTDNDFRTRAARLSGWEDIAQRLGVEQVGLNPANDAAVAEVREAQTALLDARNRAEALDERMYRELASFGPALTDAQREAYIRAYRDDPTHVETYRAVAERAEALETLLVENSAAMEDAAIRDPHFAQDLFAAHQALAQTGRAGASVAFAANVLADPQSPIAQAMSQFDVAGEILSAALPNAAAQFLVETGGDPAGAMEQLSVAMAPLIEARDAAIDDVAGNWDKLLSGEWRDPTTLASLAEGDAFTRGLAGVGLVFAISSARDAALEGDVGEAVQGLFEVGEQGAKVVSTAIAAFGEAGSLARFGRAGTMAMDAAPFIARLAPGLGAVANAISFEANRQRWDSGAGNAGTFFAMAGDLVGAVTGLLDYVPFGQVPARFFGGISSLISLGGSALDGAIEGQEMRDEAFRFLGEAGVTEPLLSALVDGRPEVIHGFANGLGLSPEQLQSLATRYPQILTVSQVHLAPVIDLAQTLGLSGDEAFDLLQTVAGDGPQEDAARALTLYLTRLEERLPGARLDAQGWLQELENDLQRADGYDPVLSAAQRRALEWLRERTGGA